MRKMLKRAMVSCVVMTVGALAQTPKDEFAGHAANLLALERMWNQAQVTHDSAAVASMIGDRFVNTEFDGAVSNRGKFLADFADPKFKPSVMNIEDVKVEMYANAAVVTGKYHTKGVYGTKPYEHFGRFTDTWILQQDGKWLCVASHSSHLKS
jgi:ketosteroid isomerase-like protein